MYTDKRGLNGNSPESLRKRVTALVFLLRWSGLRIGDAVSLERTRLTHDGRIFLYTAKTGTPVFVPIPQHVAELLHALPNSNPKYFFWTGNGLLKTAVADWQRTLRRMFKLAALDKRCHPQMLRDTFAVEMLLAGVPIEQVSILLGHSSAKITEKHYSPWVRARQEQLELSVRQAWAAVPVGIIDQSATASAQIVANSVCCNTQLMRQNSTVPGIYRTAVSKDEFSHLFIPVKGVFVLVRPTCRCSTYCKKLLLHGGG